VRPAGYIPAPRPLRAYAPVRTTPLTTPRRSIDQLQAQLTAQGYIADRELSTALYLSLALERPLLLEGETGVGKTEVTRVLSTELGAELIRLR